MPLYVMISRPNAEGLQNLVKNAKRDPENPHIRCHCPSLIVRLIFQLRQPARA